MAEPNGLTLCRDVRQSSRVRTHDRKKLVGDGAGPSSALASTKHGIWNRVFELRAETIGKLDRTERQAPATGTEDFDA